MNRIDFTDDEAVQEYITRIGIEYRYQCFTEMLPDGCHRLGDWLQTFHRDFVKAGRVFKSNCDLTRYAHSCYKYGQFALLGKGLPEKNMQDAAKYLKRGCDTEEPGLEGAKACYQYGEMIEKGLHKVDDPLESRRYFGKGCDLKDAPSCTYATGTCVKEGELQNFAQAFQFAIKGCDLGDAYSCGNLSVMYKKGDGVEMNEDMAKHYKRKADSIISMHTENRPNVTFGQ